MDFHTSDVSSARCMTNEASLEPLSGSSVKITSSVNHVVDRLTKASQCPQAVRTVFIELGRSRESSTSSTLSARCGASPSNIEHRGYDTTCAKTLLVAPPSPAWTFPIITRKNIEKCNGRRQDEDEDEDECKDECEDEGEKFSPLRKLSQKVGQRVTRARLQNEMAPTPSPRLPSKDEGEDEDEDEDEDEG